MIIKCEKGLHSYDSDQHASCPYCSGKYNEAVFIPLDGSAPDAMGQTMAPSGFNKTEMLDQKPTIAPEYNDIGATTAPDSDASSPWGPTQMPEEAKNSDVKPVRGWLVAIDGKKRGADFRIHTAANVIGRDPKCDISIDYDANISRKACIITYDNENKMFFISPHSENSTNVYVTHHGETKSQLLLAPQPLNDYDVIKLGTTRFAFRTFCNDLFDYVTE